MPSPVKRGDKWRVWVQIRGFPSESKTFEKKSEGMAWARGREEELKRRRVSHPELLLDEVVARYLKDVAPTRRMADSHAKHDIPTFRRRLGNMTVADLNGNGIVRWVMSQTDVAPATRNWNLSRLCGVLRQMEHRLEIKFPWADIEASRLKLFQLGLLSRGNERDRRVTDREIAAIKANLCAERTVRMRDIIDFCLQSCMRISEVCRITWADVNEAQKTVVIRDRKHPTKKFGNHCVVPLVQGSFETLMRQPKRSDRVFPHDATNISKKFHEAVVRAGIDDLVLHDLRHEGISRLFELGFQIQEVALVSGHTNWRTLARYTHLRPESLIAREQALRELARKEAPGNSRRPRPSSRRTHDANREASV